MLSTTYTGAKMFNCFGVILQSSEICRTWAWFGTTKIWLVVSVFLFPKLNTILSTRSIRPTNRWSHSANVQNQSSVKLRPSHKQSVSFFTSDSFNQSKHSRQHEVWSQEWSMEVVSLIGFSKQDVIDTCFTIVSLLTHFVDDEFAKVPRDQLIENRQQYIEEEQRKLNKRNVDLS